MLVSGSDRVKIEDDVVELRQWNFLRVAKGTMRNLEAGPEGAEILAFGAPTSGVDDLEMTPGWGSH